MPGHLFMTGATGFIGRRILQLWLERTDATLSVLVRVPAGTTLEEKRRRLLTGLPDDLDGPARKRIRLVPGDLARPRLGLEREARTSLAAEVTHIVHAGAHLQFNLQLDQARRVNTDGTKAVLDLARECARLERLDHLSTAYVGGSSEGTVLEDRRPSHSGHNNAYERSKCEAEILVWEGMEEVPAAILRPTIVTCDVRTGYTPGTSAFYRILHGFASGLLTVIPGRPEALLDLVPLDYVAEAAFVIGGESHAAHRCFHLSAGEKNLISLGDLRDLACDAFGRDSVEILPPDEFFRWSAVQREARPRLKSLLSEMELYLPYLSEHPLFDNRNTREVLGETSVRPTPVQDYFDRIVDFIRSQ